MSAMAPLGAGTGPSIDDGGDDGVEQTRSQPAATLGYDDFGDTIQREDSLVAQLRRFEMADALFEKESFADEPIPFAFLDLPRELRDEIYSYAMGHDGFPIKIDESVWHEDEIGWSPHERKSSVTPGLLLTSRQVFEESSLILYGVNVFQFQPRSYPRWHTLAKFRRQIGTSVRHLRKLHLEDFWIVSSVCNELERLVHLTQLSIDMPIGMDMDLDPASIANGFFELAHHWIQRVGLFHQDDTRAASVVTIRCDELCISGCNGRCRECRNECLLMGAVRSRLRDTILARKGRPFPFMKLPREIRDMIYTLACRGQGEEITLGVEIEVWWNGTMRQSGRTISGYTDGEAGFSWSDSFTPGLLAANRQIHQESIEVLYGKNKFLLNRSESATTWLTRIERCHLYLRDVTLRFYDDTYPAFFDKLLHMDRLQIDPISLALPNNLPEEAARDFYALVGHYWIWESGSLCGGSAAAIDKISFDYWKYSSDIPRHLARQRFNEELQKIYG